MDQGLVRIRHVEKGISLGRDFPQTGPDRQDEVRLLDPFQERWAGPDADVADEALVAIVEQVVAAEGTADGQIAGLGKLADSGLGAARPTTAAQIEQGPFRLRQQVAQAEHVARRRRRKRDGQGRHVIHVGACAQHILGQGEHHRSGPAADGRMEGPGHVVGDLLGAVDLGRPFGERRVHGRQVHFLKGLAPGMAARYLTDEMHHGCRVLERCVDTDAGIAGAGPAGDQADARTARELGIGFRHVRGAVFVTGRHQGDLVRCVVKGVEDFEIAFAGHAKGPFDPVLAQGVDDQLAARSGGDIRHEVSELDFGQSAMARECGTIGHRVKPPSLMATLVAAAATLGKPHVLVAGECPGDVQ